MPTDHNLGSNYTIRETDAGDLVITHGSNGDVLKYDASADEISTLKAVQSLTASSININPANTYTPTNDVTDRAFDADATTTAELADVVATLIKDLGLDA